MIQSWGERATYDFTTRKQIIERTIQITDTKETEDRIRVQLGLIPGNYYRNYMNLTCHPSLIGIQGTSSKYHLQLVNVEV